MKKLFLIISVFLASILTVAAQNNKTKQFQNYNRCEWNKYVTVYDCNGNGKTISVHYTDIANLGKYETRHINNKTVAFFCENSTLIIVQRKRKGKIYTSKL